eukprot:CAMPEP_0171334360 /NCGR_PEP_ID=MMETSP0878-20121228/4605_1 /TAXON_ID=67004 /ORGANISM="Thalassiosira weissflogii, Strain CCMP1336" /LENGTH=259 /DNA_ID=CAMNT_0011835433 /DNA_START=33 /DNA_END=812 /DNA_ORIENTATION=-
MAFKVSTLFSASLAILLSTVSVVEAFAPPVGSTVVRGRGSSSPSPSASSLFMSDGAPVSLNPSETALVLIEFQNEFTTEGGALYGAVEECIKKNNVIENASKLMNVMRDAGCSVLHVPIAFKEGHNEIGASAGILAGIAEGKTFTKDTWSSEFHPSMAPQPADLVVEGKKGLCGFFSTNLDFLLRQRGIKNVVLAGFLTNCCIESTMRTAYEHGYDVYTLKDASAATSVAAHEAAFEHNFGMFSTVSTCEEVAAAVGGA